MKKVTILDTSVATLNLGDEIIVDSVSKQLNDIFKEDIFFKVSTHEKLGSFSSKIIKQSDYSFVAGTNLLNSNYSLIRNNQWNLRLLDSFRYDNFILVGVGWGGYQGSVSPISKFMYRNVLDSEYIHSVRDNYTKEKLESIGIKNIVNTSCATMWDLTPELCSEIPTKKASNVVFTLTDYNKDIKKDQKLIDILRSNYTNVYYWAQGSNDYKYAMSLDISDVEIIPPKLSAYDELLDSDIELDYIGTRLHGGIRAMQKGRRSIIIGIDNRAIEKRKDFNLNVINRDDINSLESYINGKIITELTIDFDVINKWKEQFK